MVKPMVCVAIIIMCVASLGVAYAAWSNSLIINSQVQTGTFDVVFTQVSSSDPPGTIDPWLGRDVAVCVTSIQNGGKGILVQISRAYWGYFVSIQFTITNSGTIPARLGAPVGNNIPGKVWFLMLTNIEDTLLDPGMSLAGNLMVIVGGDLPSNTLYPFEISIPAIQWNLGN